MRTWLGCWWLCTAFVLVVSVAAAQEQAREPIVSYVIQSTSPVTLTIPVAGPTERAWARGAEGKWHELEPQMREGAVELRLGAEELHSGATVLVLDPPAWLNLQDAEPPRVLRFEVDGKDLGGTQQVSLRWVERAPRRILLEVEDAANPLDPGSIIVTAGGKLFRPGDAGVTFTAAGERRGTLEVNIPRLAGVSVRDSGAVVLTIDDYALDYEGVARSVSWRVSPSTKLEDGTVLSVASVTDASGWQNWSVVSDGEVMEQGDPTTAGVTWLSEPHDGPHGIKWQFPEPRKVSGVDLWWAYYQCYRTSVKYEVQTWDGEKWVTRVPVSGQSERQHSEHRFNAVETTRVRVFQPPMSGHPGRAEYMWLAEAQVSYE